MVDDRRAPWIRDKVLVFKKDIQVQLANRFGARIEFRQDLINLVFMGTEILVKQIGAHSSCDKVRTTPRLRQLAHKDQAC